MIASFNVKSLAFLISNVPLSPELVILKQRVKGRGKI
jgi:hypothetical protein